MSETVRPLPRTRNSKDRPRSADESPTWKISGQGARRTDGETIIISPLRGKQDLADSKQIDGPTLQTQPIEITVPPLPNAVSMSVEGGMQELRGQLTVLPRRPEETTSTANRLVGDLQTALRIITEQQETLEQYGQVIQHRQDQIPRRQEWISHQKAVQAEKVNNGRLLQDRMGGNSKIRLRSPNFPGNFPAAGFPWKFPGKSASASKIPGNNSPWNSPGSRLRQPRSREIPRGISRDAGFPGKFPGKLDAAADPPGNFPRRQSP